MKDNKLIACTLRELTSCSGSGITLLIPAVCTLIASSWRVCSSHIVQTVVLLSPCPRDVLGWKRPLSADVILVIHGKLLTCLRCGLSVRCNYAGPLIAADIHLPTKAITFPIRGLTSVSGCVFVHVCPFSAAYKGKLNDGSCPAGVTTETVQLLLIHSNQSRFSIPFPWLCHLCVVKQGEPSYQQSLRITVFLHMCDRAAAWLHRDLSSHNTPRTHLHSAVWHANLSACEILRRALRGRTTTRSHQGNELLILHYFWCAPNTFLPPRVNFFWKIIKS